VPEPLVPLPVVPVPEPVVPEPVVPVPEPLPMVPVPEPLVPVLPLPVVPLCEPVPGAQAYRKGRVKMDIAKNPFAINVLTLLSILCIIVSWLNRLGSIIELELIYETKNGRR
jgi:hypothetical protein